MSLIVTSCVWCVLPTGKWTRTATKHYITNLETQICRHSILPFTKLYQLTIFKIMYKRLHHNYLSSLIPITYASHPYPTCSWNPISTPRCSNYQLQILQNSDPRIWNSLPENIRSLNSFDIFRIKCRLWLLDSSLPFLLPLQNYST